MATIIPMAAFSKRRDQQPSRKEPDEQCVILLFNGVRYEPMPERADGDSVRRAGKGKRRRA